MEEFQQVHKVFRRYNLPPLDPYSDSPDGEIDAQMVFGIDELVRELDRAHVGISGKRVAANLIAQNKKGQNNRFLGCNIELATSKVYHAEEVALTKAISSGYPFARLCMVTSTNEGQQAAMCGYCMQTYMYANPDCVIVVVNPEDKSVKLATTVRERNGPYAYLGKGKLQL